MSHKENIISKKRVEILYTNGSVVRIFTVDGFLVSAFGSLRRNALHLACALSSVARSTDTWMRSRASSSSSKAGADADASSPEDARDPDADADAVVSQVGLQPVPVFDGSTDGTGGLSPGRLGPRARAKPGRVRDGSTRRRGTRSRPFDGFDGSPFLDGNLDQI
ncbi:hypothetical protein B0H19DRAFT_1274839 [Mycena capillaripes]|nr:hypothetical protein B0H19DRAFT_1274839 [Mycena capillaripes]